jgi:hypothetical protein
MFLKITNDEGNPERLEVNSCMLLDTSEIADADLPTGCCQFWRDEATNEIKVKTKYNDGTTIKTATIASLV